MNNSVNKTEFVYLRPWLRDELFVAILTAISLYLIVSLAIYEHRKNSKSKKNEISSGNKIENFCSCGSLCLVAVVFVLIRCLFEQIELRLGTISDVACRIYQVELVTVYHLGLTCLHLLLWTRQLKMYRHRTLRHLSSACLRTVSYVVLLGILVTSAATAIIYLLTFTLISSPVGCVYDKKTLGGPPSSLPGLLLFLIAFVFQFALLGLLIYPLIKHYHVNICCQSTNQAAKNQKNIIKTIIRLTICTTICVLSDGITSYLLSHLHNEKTPLMFWSNIYTVNLLFNIIAVVCSFADWRIRLFPCFTSGTYSTIEQTSGTTGSASV